MTISTTLLFSRAVNLMGQQQSELAALQEKVATGKELVRPSDSPDLAVNIARIKTTIGEMDAFSESLNKVNDRLRIEEAYIEGSKDILIKIKQLALQGANASMSGNDREVLATEIDELVAEMKNLANGTDANGNFLFGGSRVATPPYVEDDQGVIRYQGDTVRPQLDFTANRRSQIGRNGLDVFTPILSGESIDAVPGIYRLELNGNVESGDIHQVAINGNQFDVTVQPGDTREQVLERLSYEINESSELEFVTAEVVDGALVVHSNDGHALNFRTGSQNTTSSLNDLDVTSSNSLDGSVYTAQLSGTMETGDALRFTIGSRSFTYHINGAEGEAATPGASDIVAAAVNAATNSGLFNQSVGITADGDDIVITNRRDQVGVVRVEAIERTSINNQSMTVSLTQEPTPELPERVEFFESLQEVSRLLRSNDQEAVQGKLAHLDQMLDTVTLSMADIGSEMSSIEDELDINASLKLELETTLSGQEDLDFTTAITELQAKMMSLEAAQASFAKISQLSIFDYIR